MQATQTGLIVNHWRGEYSLERSFWLHYIVIPLALGCVLLGLLVAQIVFMFSLISPLVLVVAQGTVWVWAVRGTLRAAAQHTARGGASGRALAVKAVVYANFAAVVLFLLTIAAIAVILLDAAFNAGMLDPKWFRMVADLGERILQSIRTMMNAPAFQYRS